MASALFCRHEICRFRSRRLSQCADKLFYRLVDAQKEYGEIRYERLFVDGTKIEARDGHMRNAQLKPGYNVRFGAEGEYIGSIRLRRQERQAFPPVSAERSRSSTPRFATASYTHI